MALFQVHPHFGYLNSDVKLINDSGSLICVKDTTEGIMYEIPASSNISIRLTAGEHCFIADEVENHQEIVFVEDAIKLGGSREKKTFIFEGTPWTLMVMLDRTYFFNRNTNKQYIEHGLAPDMIKFLTPDYLLFVSEKDNSIFSLDNLSVVKTIGDSILLYSNIHYAVFSSGDDIILFSLDHNEEKVCTIKCNDYMVDKANEMLYYHIEDKGEVVCRQLQYPLSLAKQSIIKIAESFRCFIGSHSAVYGTSPQKLNIINLVSREVSILYEGMNPVTTINNKTVWKNSTLDFIQECKIKDAFTSSVDLMVFECGRHWLFTKKDKYTIINRGSISSKVRYTLSLTHNEKKYLESDQPIIIIEGTTFICAKTNMNKGVLVSDEQIQEFEGIPIFSPNGYLLISKAIEDKSKVFIDPLRPQFSYKYTGYEAENLYQKTGLIKRGSNPTTKGNEIKYNYEDVETKKCFNNMFYESLNIVGFYRLSGYTGDFVHSQDGIVRTMPSTKDRLIAISEQCNYAVTRSEDGITLLKYDVESEEWKYSALKKMNIDESFYCKAVFCSDGENIIYQKKGKEFFFRQIGSEEETQFEPQGSVIKRTINGYIPYINFDTHRNPVYVDPVSLTRIEAAAADQFTFQSIDGTIKHLSYNLEKYRDKRTQKYVTKKFYDDFVSKYDYTSHCGYVNGIWSCSYDKTDPHAKEVINNRTKYYYTNRFWLDEVLKSVCYRTRGAQNLINEFIEMDSVCDTLFFEKEFYVREEMNGEFIDIPLPNRLLFLNYVSYSHDNKYIIISGRFPMNSFKKGLALVYDVTARKIIYEQTNTMAVWLGAFSKQGMAAYYDSTPCSFVAQDVNSEHAFHEIKNRSFLTFSPSGKFIALSRQGYIPYGSGAPHWGHQPSKDVYIAKSDSPMNEIAHYCDHGDEIEGVRTGSSVASATFSKDDKKLMTVSRDGVVVIRNLHFEADTK